jgi:hypothetical protein
METVIKSLSALTSKLWKSNMDNVSYKQVKRTYQNGFSFNFPFALSGFNDFKTKEYSNFYLTDNLPASWFLNFDATTSVAPKLMTYLQSGEEYLDRSSTTPNAETYNIIFDTNTSESNYFDITFYNDNLCTVSFIESGKTYFLAEDSGSLIFKWDVYLTTDEDQYNNQFFKYIYNSNNDLFLIKASLSANKLVKKNENSLVLVELNEENKNIILTSNFKVARPKEYDLSVSPNTSFITYQNNSNVIDFSRSTFNLNNNFLIHSPYSSEYKDAVVLKNQLTVTDVFTNGQNLLSSGYDIAVDKFREYTNITTPIDSENSSEINLNYVFYNQPYTISQGVTEFQTPSSMYPFTNLNINDSRFVDCGAYAFDTPLYADKVYQLNTNNYSVDGSVYLCTWLSGSTSSKVWVDRYYYPDVISKRAALLEKGVFDITYDQAIENLIISNAALSANIAKYTIFDKKSDLSFAPNQKYTYHRFSNSTIFNTITSEATVECGIVQVPVNYQSLINASGKMTIAFYFNGDDPEWVIQSLRNNIDAGIKITKTTDNITFEFKLYDNSNNQTLTFETTTSYKKYKSNYICISYDALAGKGFFFLNNEKILDIRTILGQFSNKTLLYGKLYYNDRDIFEENSITSDIFVSDEKIDENLAFILPFVQQKETVDPIIITLPCGMRNSIDDISYIQRICNNNTNKSNYVNISIDNLGISNPDTLKDLENVMLDKVKRHIPATSTINTIKFTNYI